VSDVFHLTKGTAPLLFSFPHVGTALANDMENRLTNEARRLDDTDWLVDQLYDFTARLGASTIVPVHSRLVVDLNRPPDDANLYPGAQGTGLIPMTLFDGEKLYRDGAEPDQAEKSERVARYWRPYHAALEAELARLTALHGQVLLWDGHSIEAFIPRLFEGRLPDLNIGTADGKSCGAGIGEAVFAAAKAAPTYSAVLNGRFKGGYITRHYGEPVRGRHAVQLELAKETHLKPGNPPSLDLALCAKLRPVIRSMVEAASTAF
jgi:N-formylglutamate deformylase